MSRQSPSPEEAITSPMVPSSESRLKEAIENQKSFNQATQLPEALERIKKIPTGSTSDVVILGQTNYRGYVIGARWWSAKDKGKSYLSIMQFQPIKAENSDEIDYQPINFDRRISLTLEQFGELQKSFPKLVDFYFQSQERDDQRLITMKDQEAQIEAANNHMQSLLQVGYFKRKYPGK